MSASLGSTTYTSVTWTAGDVLTEAKLDNMVANDQAYDSHAAQGLLLNNAKSFAAKDSGGTNRNIAKIGTDNIAEFGDEGLTDHVPAGTWSGWVRANETWTYASATTITVPSDATTKYQKGDKIRLKQGGGYKYFYIVGVSATLLTVTGGSDYSVANAAITDNDYSKMENPQGFPDWFNFTPSFTGFSVDPTVVAKFTVIGNTCVCKVKTNAGGTSNATSFTVTAPITAANNSVLQNAPCAGQDNSADLTNSGRVRTRQNSNIVDIYKTWAGGAWTASGAKYADFILVYEI